MFSAWADAHKSFGVLIRSVINKKSELTYLTDVKTFQSAMQPKTLSIPVIDSIIDEIDQCEVYLGDMIGALESLAKSRNSTVDESLFQELCRQMNQQTSLNKIALESLKSRISISPEEATVIAASVHYSPYLCGSK